MNPERSSYDAVIIGSGLGGLLCGAILAKEGMKVCLLEQHSQPGGCLQNFRRNGIAFDTGMHYTGSLGAGQNLYRYWNYLGIMKDLKIERLDVNGFDRIVIGEKEFPLAQGFDNFVRRLLPFFPESESSLLQFIRQIKKVSEAFPLYNIGVPSENNEELFLLTPAFDFFHSLQENKRGASLLPKVLGGNQFLYDGDPERTPLYIPALINHSFITSAWRWTDGSSQLAEALLKAIASNGGELLTRSKVARISREKNEWVAHSGDGRSFSAMTLISDIHPANTLRILDPGLIRKAYYKRVTGLPDTSSSFALYIVLEEGKFPYMNANYHVFPDQERTVKPGSDKPRSPSHYLLYTPPFTGNKGFAKSLIVMTRMDFNEVKKWENTFTGQRDPSYREFKEMRAEKLLDEVSLRFPEIRSCIRSMEISTPLTWRDYTGTPGGSMYGIARDFHNPLRTLVMPRTPLPGLYMTGQNVNIHGALGVTISAFMTCGERIGMDYLLNKVKNVV